MSDLDGFSEPILSYAVPPPPAGDDVVNVEDDSTRRRRGVIAGLIAVIAIALLAALFFLFDPFDRTPKWTIFDVENRLGKTVDSFVLNGPDGSHQIGPILPGKTASVKLRTQLGYSYQYTLITSGTPSTGQFGFDSDMRGTLEDYDIWIEVIDGKVKATPP